MDQCLLRDILFRKNGQITACLTFSAPGPGDFTCPGGQIRTLSSVTYTGIFVKDETAPVGPVAATPQLAREQSFYLPVS